MEYPFSKPLEGELKIAFYWFTCYRDMPERSIEKSHQSAQIYTRIKKDLSIRSSDIRHSFTGRHGVRRLMQRRQKNPLVIAGAGCPKKLTKLTKLARYGKVHTGSRKQNMRAGSGREERVNE